MFKLKDDFVLGVASASMQTEGGELDSNWHDWYRRGKIKDGTSPANANDHYKRYAEDYQIMQDLGIREYRFSVEWSRIEPVEGQFDDEVLAHYRGMVVDLRSRGIRPLLTLWHFSYPMWFERLGGFYEEANVRYFLRYVKEVLKALGDLVDDYITINEPNVWAIESYLMREWPPSEKNGVFSAVRVMSVLAACHIEAYQLIKETYPKAQVSFAHHLRVFVPKRRMDTPLMHLMRFGFQDAVTKMFAKGEFPFPFRNYHKLKPGDYIDFWAVNYYTRTVVKGIRTGFGQTLPKNDLGWDIYPEGLVELCRKIYDYVPKPIYITENGTCDNDDRFRARYIYEHVEVINQSDLPIKRYYYWSFSDNFEWAEGESSRFGLVHIDYKTQERQVKDSGLFYRDIIRDHGVTEACYKRYVEGSHYDPN